MTAPTFLGVDGCRAGWVYAAWDGREWEIGVRPSLREVLDAFPDAAAAFVDIPIGLREQDTRERSCDLAARSVLKPRASSVFPAPSRGALGAAGYEEACDVNEEATDRRLSRQSWAIAPKIREVDELLRDEPGLVGVVREVHPEVCFWALAGRTPMAHPKKSSAGREERLAVLRAHVDRPETLLEDALARHGGDVARDDVLDALAAAVTARDGWGRYETLPEEPEEDPAGLPMEIVYWVPDATPTTLTARYSHALTLSYVWHRTQMRKGRDTPYLAHLMSVSALVLEAGGGEELGIAGLLHDALEDAPGRAAAEAREEVIAEEFGPRVLSAVRGCTDGYPDEKSEMGWCDRKERYLAHLRGDDPEDAAHPDAVRVSLCDKLHNARSILRDLEAEGEGLWSRFSTGRAGTLWYYASLLEAYRSRADALPGGFARHVDELEGVLVRVFEVAGTRMEDVEDCPE